jgi:hypothetical protein
MPAHLDRTEETKQKLAAEIVDYLNEILRVDPQAITALIDNRIACNQELSDHPTLQVSGTVGSPTVGLLGIINGLVGVRADGWGYITAVYDDEEGRERLTHFERSKERDASFKEFT